MATAEPIMTPLSDAAPLTRRERAARTLIAQPLTRHAFAPFGDVLDASGEPDRLINRGRCARFDAVAALDFGDRGGAVGVLRADMRATPYQLNMVEKHRHGSQTFIPMNFAPYLVMVSHDEAGQPGRPLAFLATPGQGVSYHRETWRAVLTPIREPGLFTVIEPGGGEPGLEFWFEKPYFVVLGKADSPA